MIPLVLAFIAVSVAVGETAVLSALSQMSKVNQLVIQPEQGSARLMLGSNYALQMNEKGVFAITADLKAEEQRQILAFDTVSDTFSSEASVISGDVFDVSQLHVSGIPQWALMHTETFDGNHLNGWKGSPVVPKFLNCGGVNVLCGNCPNALNQETNTVMDEEDTPNVLSKSVPLPTGTRWDSLKITATFHFIDDWQGESAFMKIDGQIVWVSAHTTSSRASKFLDLCSGDEIAEPFPEDRFSVPIQVSIDYPNSKSVFVEFGSNAAVGSGAYFGVSSLTIEVRQSAVQSKGQKTTDVEE